MYSPPFCSLISAGIEYKEKGWIWWDWTVAFTHLASYWGEYTIPLRLSRPAAKGLEVKKVTIRSNKTQPPNMMEDRREEKYLAYHTYKYPENGWGER